MTPSAGEIWLADRGAEIRSQVLVISDARFHRLADRAVVAPVLDEMPASPMPWHLALASGVAAVNQLGTLPVERLLERTSTVSQEVLRQARRAVSEIAGC